MCLLQRTIGQCLILKGIFRNLRRKTIIDMTDTRERKNKRKHKHNETTKHVVWDERGADERHTPTLRPLPPHSPPPQLPYSLPSSIPPSSPPLPLLPPHFLLSLSLPPSPSLFFSLSLSLHDSFPIQLEPSEADGGEFLSSSQRHDSDFQGASSSETARFPGEHESLRRGVRGRLACWNTRHDWSLGRHDFAATATIQGIRMLLARCLDKRDQGQEAFVADYTQAFREGEQLYAQPPEGWNPKILMDGTRVVWNVRKAMVGLRTSPRRWQEHLLSKLKEHGFVQDERDPCLRTRNWTFALVCISTTCWLWVPVN